MIKRNIKLTHIKIVTTPQQRCLSLKQMETFTENHNWTESRDQEIEGAQPQQIYLYHSSCIYVSGNTAEKDVERF